jgi:hypothetical protein
MDLILISKTDKKTGLMFFCLISEMLGNIVDEQGTDSSPVVPACNKKRAEVLRSIKGNMTPNPAGR